MSAYSDATTGTSFSLTCSSAWAAASATALSLSIRHWESILENPAAGEPFEESPVAITADTPPVCAP